MRAAARTVAVALAGLSLFACSGIQVQVGVYQTLEEARLAGAINTAGSHAVCPNRRQTCARGTCRTAGCGVPSRSTLPARTRSRAWLRPRSPAAPSTATRRASRVVATNPAIAHRFGTREGNRLSDLSGSDSDRPWPSTGGTGERTTGADRSAAAFSPCVGMPAGATFLLESRASNSLTFLEDLHADSVIRRRCA